MFTLIIEDKHGAIVDEYSFEDGEFIIGRSNQVDIVLPADNVSRRHARLFTVDGRCFIEDLKAANGVWLNGKRIYNVTELPRSAQVRIGDFFLHIEGAAYARPLGTAVFARLIPIPDSAGNVTDLSQPTVLVGRGKDCTVVLNDVSVSRIHSKITQDQDGRIFLEDLRSSNGTYVNDRRIERARLMTGDRLRVGRIELAVSRGDH
jgi:pSer/pThr/pTyr-binding forkhead associated (FHA) protein